MFDFLIESNRKGHRDMSGTIGGLFFSTAFQTAIIVAAVYATMQVAEEAPIDMGTIVITWDEPDDPDQPPPPVITSLNPPPKGFQVLMPPVDIPQEIPPVDLSQRFDPRDYTPVGVEGGVFSGIDGDELSISGTGVGDGVLKAGAPVLLFKTTYRYFLEDSLSVLVPSSFGRSRTISDSIRSFRSIASLFRGSMTSAFNTAERASFQFACTM